MSDDDKKERDDGLTEQAARAYADEVARLQGRIAELLREQDTAKKKQEEKEQEMARSEHTEWCPAPAVHCRARAIAAEARIKAFTDEPLLALAEQAIKRMATEPRLSPEEATKSAARFISGETAPAAFLDRNELLAALTAMTRNRDQERTERIAMTADADKAIRERNDAWERQRKAEEERDALAAKLDQLRRNRDENIAEVRRLDNEIGIAKVNRITLIIERDDAIARAEKAEEEQRALREALANFVAYVDSYSNPSDVPATVRVRALLAKEST